MWLPMLLWDPKGEMGLSFEFVEAMDGEMFDSDWKDFVQRI